MVSHSSLATPGGLSVRLRNSQMARSATLTAVPRASLTEAAQYKVTITTRLFQSVVDFMIPPFERAFVLHQSQKLGRAWALPLSS